MASGPSLVLVHGSWHSPKHFEPLIKVLKSYKYRCVPVSLPSTQSEDEAPATLSDDSSAIRQAVVGELDLGNNVVVVAHSYGVSDSKGLHPTVRTARSASNIKIANNALERLDTKSRSGTKESTSVLAVAFIAAAPVATGTSFLELLGGHPQPIHDRKSENFTYVGGEGPEHYFYNDLSVEDAKHWASLLRPQSWPAYLEKTTYAAYTEIPCSYLYCTKDQALPYGFQQVMVKKANDSGGRIGYTEVVETSHSPFLSMPERTAEFLVKVAEQAVQSK